MNAEFSLLVVFLTWMAFGPVLAVVMGRRGHSPWTWAIIGIFLGPLAVPLAIDARRRRRDARPTALAIASPGLRPLSVLVGINGSHESRVALARAVVLFGDRIGRLSLVTVVDYDTAEAPWRFADAVDSARQWMAAARAAAGDIDADEYVVPGEPAQALTRMASEGGYNLLVAGSRGREMSPRVFGSVAQELAASSPVPVLIGGQGMPGTRPVRQHEPGNARQGRTASAGGHRSG